jgi:hypothetical protein
MHDEQDASRERVAAAKARKAAGGGGGGGGGALGEEEEEELVWTPSKMIDRLGKEVRGRGGDLLRRLRTIRKVKNRIEGGCRAAR